MRLSRSTIAPSYAILALAIITGVTLVGEAYFFYQEINLTTAAYNELLVTEKQQASAEATGVLAATLATPAAQIERYFITADTVSEVIEEMERLSGVTKVNFSLTAAEISTDETPKVTISFMAAGTFAQLNQLATLVGHMPYGLRFTDLRLDRGEGTAWQGQFTFEITSLETTEL